MPYKKTYQKKTFAKKRRPSQVQKTKQLVTGRGPTMLETMARGASSVASLARAVMPIIAAINTEQKFVDNQLSQTITTASSFVMCPNPIIQGVDENQRIGNSLLAKDLTYRMSILPNFTSLTTVNIRFILVCDKQQSGSTPTAALLFQNASDLMHTPFNRDYTDRFVIMRDKYMTFTKLSNEAAYEKNYKKLDFHIRYLTPTTLASSLGNNSLFFFIFTDASSTGPVCTISSRLNFTDN